MGAKKGTERPIREREHTMSARSFRFTRPTLTDDDWDILASLTEPRHLNQLPIKVAQRCLHLYKAGYIYTDAQGWVTLSLHGRRELGRRHR